MVGSPESSCTPGLILSELSKRAALQAAALMMHGMDAEEKYSFKTQYDQSCVGYWLQQRWTESVPEQSDFGGIQSDPADLFNKKKLI